MNNSAEKILYRKAALIFEELGFLMPRPDNAGGAQDGSTSAMVFFKGPFSGYLLVSLSTEILTQLSGNMLGEDAVSSEVLQHDSLKEISNVICGNALPAIYGFEPIFHLDAPIIYEGTNTVAKAVEYNQEAQVRLSFDAGTAEISLFVESSAPEARAQ
jgi:CheY-specific phosphatase CheX